MSPDNSKISKACEPCRRRKVRCDGTEPCSNCQSHPLACAYRLKARVRPRRQQLPCTQTNLSTAQHTTEHEHSIPPDSTSPNSRQESRQEPAADVYRGIVGAHLAPQVADSSQLFYGPSSTFAFIQQIHRQILPLQPIPDVNRCQGEQADGSSLDLFRQRAIFFGVPLRADIGSPAHVRSEFHIVELVSKELATEFLDNFKVASLRLLPFFTEEALDRLLQHMYADGGRQMHPQKQALFLIILAIGALSTTRTELAETLFLQAKREAVPYEEAVTLSMIQFSLLIADYQINMGRPNAAYLHVGAACRKALAWGLNTATGNVGPEYLQERHTTLWCMYYMET